MHNSQHAKTPTALYLDLSLWRCCKAQQHAAMSVAEQINSWSQCIVHGSAQQGTRVRTGGRHAAGRHARRAARRHAPGRHGAQHVVAQLHLRRVLHLCAAGGGVSAGSRTAWSALSNSLDTPRRAERAAALVTCAGATVQQPRGSRKGARSREGMPRRTGRAHFGAQHGPELTGDADQAPTARHTSARARARAAPAPRSRRPGARRPAAARRSRCPAAPAAPA